jgi:predicted site-specific integrase-resolvase
VRIGYARVSTQDQRLDVQREALRGSRCDEVVEDSVTDHHDFAQLMRKRLDSPRIDAGVTGVVDDDDRERPAS